MKFERYYLSLQTRIQERVDDIIHNRIIYKKIIRRFLKEFNRKYCKKEVFGKYFEIKKSFYVINKQRHEI